MTAKITKWVASAALAAVFATGVNAQTDPIKVGFVLSLSMRTTSANRKSAARPPRHS